MDHFAYEHFYSLINKKDNSILLLLIINNYKNKNSYLTLQPMYYTRMFSRYFHTNIRSRKYIKNKSNYAIFKLDKSRFISKV